MSLHRQKWASFICSSSTAGKYLHASGNVNIISSDLLNSEDVTLFLERLTDRDNDIKYLSRIFYILQPRIFSFFKHLLPELLQSLTHIGVSSSELSRGGNRGKAVLWPQTILAQSSGKADAGTFLVRNAEKSPDTPENQLLKLFLFNVVSIIEQSIKSVGTGALSLTLDEIRKHANVGLKSAYMQGVRRLPKSNVLMYQRARSHPNWRYGLLSNLQLQLDAIQEGNRWELIISLLRKGWLEPIDSDDLFELYMLALVLDILEREIDFGAPYKYGLIKSGRRAVAQFHRAGDGSQAAIFFDQSPKSALGLQSEYTSIINEYDGVSGIEHRPDILIDFFIPRLGKRRLVVEVKETQDERYKRDSIYKVLAYLRDFSSIWDDAGVQHPKAILAFPSRVIPKAGLSMSNRDLAFVSSDDRQRLVQLIQQATN